MNLNHEPKTVTKPWGFEIWHCLSKDFCVKTIKLIKGSKTSYQWHRKKEEINFIRSGEAELWLEDDNSIVQKYSIKTGDSFFVPATKKHRVIALTDLEMFEVSNEFIDDVVRIDDEFGRKDGRIDAEHKLPAILILAAGLGSRLKDLTRFKNKGLIPINNKAVISHIIEKFPAEYEIVIAIGYEKESLREYCQLAHPERKFQFVEVDKWDDPKTNPGHSALACQKHLQRPFYLTAVDCLIEKEIPHIDGNWIGSYPTDYPEKYATLNIEKGNILEVSDKMSPDFENAHKDAFIGVAAVLDYAIFWEQLTKANGQLVGAWKVPSQYPTLKAKELKWFDSGNLADLEAAKEHFGDKPLGSTKVISETIYRIGNRVLKFHPSQSVNDNRFARGYALKEQGLAPRLGSTPHFLVYEWQVGRNLYHHDSQVHNAFLNHLDRVIRSSSVWEDCKLVRSFYEEKTKERLALFVEKYGVSYLEERTINGINRSSLNALLQKVNFTDLESNPLYSGFHGDMHFDNIIYDEKERKFIYIDWRESFNGEIKGGDLYYDLGKLYAGTLVPFELLKDDANVILSEGSSTVNYRYETCFSLQIFKKEYENWIVRNNHDLKLVKLVAALALLNISPLHTDTWNKVLFFKGIELLHETLG